MINEQIDVASYDCLNFSHFELLKMPFKFLWESYLHGILSIDFGR